MNRFAMCVAVVFDARTALARSHYQSAMTRMYWFPCPIFGIDPTMSMAINLKVLLAGDSCM